MEIYKIYEGNIPRLERKLRFISKKCEKYGTPFHYEQLGEVFEKKIKETGEEVVYRYVNVSVSGTAVVPGWRLIASVHRERNGNIIKKSCFDVEVPKRYWTDEPYCEHCGSRRFRNQSYIVQNTETGDFKEVGRNCLCEYTHGMSAEMAANYISFYDSLMEFEAPLPSCRTPIYMNTETVLLYAAETIRIYGYENRVTAERVSNYYDAQHGHLPFKIQQSVLEEMRKVGFCSDRDCNGKTVKEAIDWITGEAATTDTDYMHNLKTVCGLEYMNPQYIGILVSLLPAYERHKKQEEKKRQQQAESERSQWVGNTGDRITIDVSTYHVITSWKTEYDDLMMVYKVVDVNGNIYIWKTTKCIDCKDGENFQMIATVKDHTLYGEIKQTVITRCRVKETR